MKPNPETKNAVAAALDRSDAVAPRAGSSENKEAALPDLQRKTRPLKDLACEVEIDLIRADPRQPRRSFSKRGLQELAENIKVHGIMNPLEVRVGKTGDAYYLVAGERRLRAARLLGLESVPVIVKTDRMTRREIMPRQLSENLLREDLAPIETARALAEYIKREGISAREAARRLGKTKSFVSDLLHILAIPREILVRAARRRGIRKHALIEISRIKDPTAQVAAFNAMLTANRPVQVAKRARNGQAARSNSFYAHFRPDDAILVGKLSSSKPHVSKKRQIQFLERWLQHLKRPEA